MSSNRHIMMGKNMTGIEIAFLILGIVLLVAGYVIPESKSEDEVQNVELSREETRAALDGHIEDAKISVDEMVEETLSYSMEKAERGLERISNDKISAVGEYAQTVLDDINKNHKEVMFLYDMLNEKSESLKELVAQSERAGRDLVSSAERAAKEMEALQSAGQQSTPAAEAMEDGEKEPLEALPEAAAPAKTKTRQPRKAAPKEKISVPESEVANIQFEGTGDDSSLNNNEKILELYKQGKSNMVIAKQLGLGVGEVKLVIDLFKGMSQ